MLLPRAFLALLLVVPALPAAAAIDDPNCYLDPSTFHVICTTDRDVCNETGLDRPRCAHVTCWADQAPEAKPPQWTCSYDVDETLAEADLQAETGRQTVCNTTGVDRPRCVTVDCGFAWDPRPLAYVDLPPTLPGLLGTLVPEPTWACDNDTSGTLDDLVVAPEPVAYCNVNAAGYERCASVECDATVAVQGTGYAVLAGGHIVAVWNPTVAGCAWDATDFAPVEGGHEQQVGLGCGFYSPSNSLVQCRVPGWYN